VRERDRAASRPVKKVEDLDEYLTEVAEKGEFTAESEQQISGALETVRELISNG
jgi:hypothetical protein